MKFLVDTCGWIEWITAGSLANKFEPYFKQSEKLVIPTILQFELYRWLCRERDETLAIESIGVTEQSLVAPADTMLVLLAADLAKQYDLAMADAIIYATSRIYHAALITSDKHFQGLPEVTYFSK